MKLKLLMGAVVVCVTMAALVLGRQASAQQPGPSAGEVLVSGLDQPKGMAIGSDGMLYVAESGNGGDTELEDGSNVGLTGRISRIDPETGARETVADNLPSNALPDGDAVGPADVAFIGSTLYYLQTHGGEFYESPDMPTGIYRVDTDDGSVDLVADIYEFNVDNPVQAITDGVQQDVEVGGNPYSMDVRNGVFYVVDGNHNRMMRITTTGDIEEVTEFPNHPVSTGMDFAADGTARVAYLGQGPFFPQDGKVVSVNINTGAITELASGASMLTDVEFGPAGQLYALQFNDTSNATSEEDAFGPFKGNILRVNPDGTLTKLVTGLTFTTFLEFDGDTAYISNFAIVPGMGEIVKIENFSTVQPPAPTPTTAPPAPTTAPPQPTATRPAGIVAPDTGTGGYADPGNGGYTWLVALIAAGALLSMGGVVALRRR
jgi:sugar lactone lactonase YvrE